jgi:hypothetical protein
VVAQDFRSMSTNYPELTKSQLMLLLLWSQLQEAYDGGDSKLRLSVIRGSPETGVWVISPRLNVSEEIPELSRGGEAVAVFDRLWRGGYVHVSFGSRNPVDTMTTPVLYGLSTDGLIDIGKFPDPDERLAHAFEIARDLLEEDPGIPFGKKKEMLDTMSKVVGLFNDVAGLGTAVAKGLGPMIGS